MTRPSSQENPDPIDVEVGRRVKQLRKARGESQTALGDAIGVSFQQIQKYERGTNRFAASTLIRVARALETPLAELLADFDEGAEPWRGWKLPNVPGLEELADCYAAIESAEARRAVLTIVRSLAAPETQGA